MGVVDWSISDYHGLIVLLGRDLNLSTIFLKFRSIYRLKP